MQKRLVSSFCLGMIVFGFSLSTRFIDVSFVPLFLFSVLLAVIFVILSLEKKISFTSQIKKNSSLKNLAEDASQNESVQRELDHLVLELSKGNLHAGLGRPGHLEGTDIYYLRGRNGGRLYYHKTKDGYDILAKSGKGSNQEKVINKLLEMYGK